MKESCHTHRDHQHREKKVISHINKSYHKWMSHITCEWVISHIDESCHIWKSHVTGERDHRSSEKEAAPSGTAHTHHRSQPCLHPRLESRLCSVLPASICGDAFIWDVIHSYGTWLIHMGRDSFICGVHAPPHLIVSSSSLSISSLWCAACIHLRWRIRMGRASCIWDLIHSYETWVIHHVTWRTRTTAFNCVLIFV